jgi:hypothetical protein
MLITNMTSLRSCEIILLRLPTTFLRDPHSFDSCLHSKHQETCDSAISFASRAAFSMSSVYGPQASKLKGFSMSSVYGPRASKLKGCHVSTGHGPPSSSDLVNLYYYRRSVFCLSVRPHQKLSTNVIADRPFFARTTGTGRTPALRSLALLPRSSPELFDPQSSKFCVLYMQIRANFNFNFIFSSML